MNTPLLEGTETEIKPSSPEVETEALAGSSSIKGLSCDISGSFIIEESRTTEDVSTAPSGETRSSRLTDVESVPKTESFDVNTAGLLVKIPSTDDEASVTDGQVFASERLAENSERIPYQKFIGAPSFSVLKEGSSVEDGKTSELALFLPSTTTSLFSFNPCNNFDPQTTKLEGSEIQVAERVELDSERTGLYSFIPVLTPAANPDALNVSLETTSDELPKTTRTESYSLFTQGPPPLDPSDRIELLPRIEAHVQFDRFPLELVQREREG